MKVLFKIKISYLKRETTFSTTASLHLVVFNPESNLQIELGHNKQNPASVVTPLQM